MTSLVVTVSVSPIERWLALAHCWKQLGYGLTAASATDPTSSDDGANSVRDPVLPRHPLVMVAIVRESPHRPRADATKTLNRQISRSTWPVKLRPVADLAWSSERNRHTFQIAAETRLLCRENARRAVAGPHFEQVTSPYHALREFYRMSLSADNVPNWAPIKN